MDVAPTPGPSAIEPSDAPLPEGLSLDDLRLETEGARPTTSQRTVDPHPHGELPRHSELHAEHRPHHAPTFEEFVTGWELGIYRDPVLCAVLAGVALGMLGVVVVLRRAVFVTAAISQAAGLGVALAFLIAGSASAAAPLAGALLLALVASSSLALPAARLRVPREGLLGFAFLASSAGALLVGDRIAAESHDVAAILFGTAVLVRPLDLWLVASAAVLSVVLIGVGHRGLTFAGFDPEGARVQGLPVLAISLVFWCVLALMVAVSTRALGSLPVFALAVLPGMAALSLVEGMKPALLLSGVLGGAVGGLGYLFAFRYEFPVGASQAALCAAVFAVCLLVAWVRRR